MIGLQPLVWKQGFFGSINFEPNLSQQIRMHKTVNEYNHMKMNVNWNTEWNGMEWNKNRIECGIKWSKEQMNENWEYFTSLYLSHNSHKISVKHCIVRACPHTCTMRRAVCNSMQMFCDTDAVTAVVKTQKKRVKDEYKNRRRKTESVFVCVEYVFLSCNFIESVSSRLQDHSVHACVCVCARCTVCEAKKRIAEANFAHSPYKENGKECVFVCMCIEQANF